MPSVQVRQNGGSRCRTLCIQSVAFLDVGSTKEKKIHLLGNFFPFPMREVDIRLETKTIKKRMLENHTAQPENEKETSYYQIKSEH